MRLREGVFTSQVASKEKQNEEELTALKEVRNSTKYEPFN